MFKFDYITKEDIKEQNPNQPEIHDHAYIINHEPDIDTIFSYAKDPYEAKYQLLINILILFDDMIIDMLSNKKLNKIVTELFIRGRK